MNFADIVGIIGLIIFVALIFKLTVTIKESIKEIPN